MYDILDLILTELPKRQPRTYRAVYPRRILPPSGFINPKYFALTLLSELEIGFQEEMNMLPHITGYVNCLIQMEYRVPTFFIKSEFAQAVAQTEPPEDFKFSEIKWPLPAMLFVLPTDFCMKTFGFLVPFISITNVKTGIYPDRLKTLPSIDPSLVSYTRDLHAVENKVDRISIVYPVYAKNQAPVDYTGSYPITMNVNEMDSAPYHDATYYEEACFNLPDSAHTCVDFPKEGPEEKAFNSKVQAFAVKLMLALTARPDLIKIGSISRPERIKKGELRDALWHPNRIGWDYHARQRDSNGSSGTHRSPRMHWRRGHFHNTPHGPQWTLRKLDWREPVLVCGPET